MKDVSAMSGEMLKAIEEKLKMAAELISKGEHESALKELINARDVIKHCLNTKREKRELKKLQFSLLMNIAYALNALQRYEEALTYTNDACKDFPRNPMCSFLRAQALIGLKRYDEAIKEIKRAKSGYKDNAEMLLQLAKMAFEIGAYKLAKDCSLRAISLDSKLVDAHMLLAESLKEMGDINGALNALLTALSSAAQDPQLKVKASELFRILGETRRAIELMEEALKELDDPNIRIALAELYMDIGNYAKVVEHCKEALKKNKNDPLLLDILAFAYLQLGELDEAIQVLVRLAHIAPTDVFTRFKLATLYHQKGAYAKAMREYQRVIALEPNGLLSEPARAAIQQLDEIQLQQVFMLSAEDPVFRTKLLRDPIKALSERGFYLTEASLEMLKNLDPSMIPKEKGITPA